MHTTTNGTNGYHHKTNTPPRPREDTVDIALLAAAGAVMDTVGSSTDGFTVRVTSNDECREVTLRHPAGAALPEPGAARVDAEGWLPFSDLEVQVVEFLRSKPRSYFKYDDLADALADGEWVIMSELAQRVGRPLSSQFRTLVETLKYHGRVEKCPRLGVRLVQAAATLP
jgi:hypothetical protein